MPLPLPIQIRFGLPGGDVAKDYVSRCLEVALEIGQGQGPVGHVPAPPWP